ncbi:hypothetical protein QJS10_CPA02g01597 [Acorus calamus]|uniref:Uncharacterized protein n=1 Tax=Acorus calamus TaxID=4465 RepID=A0AAV9FGJ1_ACOCL|nr:hypothetical protein QJS10_CPA02g01597 [Acorus calamus]
MNATIIDPLQGDFPEVIEEFLKQGNTRCIAFNRRGTLLAGTRLIYNFSIERVDQKMRFQVLKML